LGAAGQHPPISDVAAYGVRHEKGDAKGATMSDSAGDGIALPARANWARPDAARGIRLVWAEAALAAVAFAALCLVVLSVAPQIAEPDDGAYHHSIMAMTMGNFVTLSRQQLDAVDAKLDGRVGQVPNQWVELADGRYISEKNPGYPFLAAPFEALGIIRWAPLFYGALACLGLFIGARRWLGRFGGLAAVGLYCSSGAAMAFAWRDYMPTFTDASLIAAGSGFLLWAVLAPEASHLRRTWVGLAGFAAIELATFVRYTNIVVLGCAVVAVIVAWRLRATRLSLRTLGWWLASVAVLGAVVAIFDDVVYGGPSSTGYPSGDIAFSLDAIVPNLESMPAHLMEAMPMLVLGLIALAWVIVRWLALGRTDGEAGAGARRDLWVGLTVAASWFAIWGLYSAYTWTADPTSVSVQVVRFYVPAIGAISLLGAWLVTRIPGRAGLAGLTAAAVITALFALGVSSFYAMYAAFDVPLGG
jgi:hypothetical protein